ncbi:MAG: nucleotidyltransferase family protein, partial [Thermodesulfobacteriota bacterium]|nr:nucleotidyltransferase family protein [Thermodesulfobacteriota bacterium]
YRAEIDLPAKHEEKFMEQENSISFYHKSSIPIDLHWEITGRYLLCPVYMDTFADRIESTLFFERDIFSIPDDIMLVYLCVHGTSHCWERLEWLCCFIELLNRQNEETIFNALNFAEQINAKRIFLLGLFLGQSVLEAKYPANVQSVIEYDDGIVKAGEKISSQMFDTGSDSGHDSSAGAAWRFSPLHVMIRDSLKDKIGYLVFLLTMPTVKEWSKYPIPYTLTPFYRVIRPFRLAWLFLVGNKLERSFFSSGYKRVKEMVAKKRMKGRGLFFTCFIYLPGRFIEKFLSNSCILINKYIFNKYINKQRLERFHDSHDHIMDHHFYMIGMPGKIDFLEASLELIHNKINLFVILNGVKEGEKKQITKKFPDLPVFDLSTFYSSSIPHGEVINLLMQANEKPFGLIDHDLYIFNDQIFSQLDFNNDEFISGPFEIHNQKAELTFPATFFLYINTPIVKKIMNKYNIGAQIYTRIPSRLLPILNDMNLGYDNFLKGYLNYFDPFNLIFAMAFYEGYKAKILKKNEKDMIHLGGHATDEIIQSKEKLKQVIDSIRQ